MIRFRVKTLEELTEEFGDDWHINWLAIDEFGWAYDDMNHLFGKYIEVDDSISEVRVFRDDVNRCDRLRYTIQQTDFQLILDKIKNHPNKGVFKITENFQDEEGFEIYEESWSLIGRWIKVEYQCNLNLNHITHGDIVINKGDVIVNGRVINVVEKISKTESGVLINDSIIISDKHTIISKSIANDIL